MAAYEKKTGGNVLAIAHNGNLSNGRMFPIVEAFTGKRIDREYAEQRARVGAALRGHADQGRRRGASVPLAQRRVRQLRALGQGQSRRQRGEEARRCSSSSTPARRSRTASSSKQQLGVEPVQVRPGRQHRRAHRPRRDRRGQLLRQDHAAGAEPRAADRDLHRTTPRPA